MKEIKLTQGKVALVDDADFDWLNQWNWYAVKDRTTFYARRQVRCADGTQRQLHMHSVILGCKADHKDRDGLNNQRHNLRPCTHQQNCLNKGKRSHNKSGFLGVMFAPRHTKRPWRIHIKYKGKQLGTVSFATAIEAAKARDALALKYHGEFAVLNFPNGRV